MPTLNPKLQVAATTPTSHPAERDVEEMTVIPTSYNCPLPSQPFALRAHTALESTTASSPFPAAFTVSRDLIPLLGARTVLPLLQTDRGVGEAGGGARDPSFFACHEGCLNAWEDGRREVYNIYARGIFSSYRDFCTLLWHVIGAFKFQISVN